MLDNLMKELDNLFGETPKEIKKGTTRWGKNNKYFMSINNSFAIAIDFSTGEKHKILLSNKKITQEEYKEYILSLEEMKYIQSDFIKNKWNELPLNNKKECFYFENKKVKEPYGVKYLHDEVYIPYYNFKYGLSSIQKINNVGNKIFIKNSISTCSFAVVDKVKLNDIEYICITEGVATALSANECLIEAGLKNFCVLASGSSYNIPFLYNELLNRFYGKKIFGIADNDFASKNAFKCMNNKVIHLLSNQSGYDINDAMNDNREQTINFMKEQLNERCF